MKPTPSTARRSLRCFALCGFFLCWGYSLTAATLTVTNLNDDGPGTLRDAITNAAPDDTIDFAIFGTITLTNGELVINTNLTISGPGETNLTLNANLNSRLLRVNAGIVNLHGLRFINGSVSANGGAISNSATLTVTDCVFLNNFTTPGHGGAIYSSGDLTAARCRFMTNATLVDSGDGGAIFSSGTLTVSNCIFNGNLAVAGGGIENRGVGTITMSTFTNNSTDADGDGGGIENSGGTLTIRDSILSGNKAVYGSGAGIISGGTMIVSNCIFSGNGAGGDGSGGAIAAGGNCTVTDSILSGNSATSGGCIYTEGTFALNRCTVSGNSSFHGGQGIANYGGSFTAIQSTIANNGGSFAESGGGFFVYSGNVALTNCTISGNASSTGGGFHNFGGNVTLESCTVARNATYNEGRGVFNSGTFFVRNTIIASNSFKTSSNAFSDIFGSFTSKGNNLIGKSDGGTGFTNGVQSDLVGTIAVPVDAKLGPLLNNGGLTSTHAVLSNSPAIDAGTSGGLLTDQRGGLRPYIKPGNTNALPGDGSDIGAFESGGYLRLTSVNKTNNDIRVQFTTDLGHDYYVERRDAFDTNAWIALPGSVPGTGGIVPFVETNAALLPQGFYRVRVD